MRSISGMRPISVFLFRDGTHAAVRKYTFQTKILLKDMYAAFIAITINECMYMRIKALRNVVQN